MTASGVSFNKERQLEFLRAFAAFYDQLPLPEHASDRCRFHCEGSPYPYPDAIFLYSFLRQVQPRQMIEVGSGCSSALIGNSFFINGQQWSPDRDDAVTQIGDVEEWTVRNVTGEHHVFHIHQTDFLVTKSNGERIDIGKMMDTVNVPFARNGRPGEVKLIMPFLEDRIAGRFVYHCHILEHEDGGMMANINVQPRR